MFSSSLPARKSGNDWSADYLGKDGRRGLMHQCFQMTHKLQRNNLFFFSFQIILEIINGWLESDKSWCRPDWKWSLQPCFLSPCYCLDLLAKLQQVGAWRSLYNSVNTDCHASDGELGVCGFPGLPAGGLLQPSGRQVFRAGQTVNYSCQGWRSLIIPDLPCSLCLMSPPLITYPSQTENTERIKSLIESRQSGGLRLLGNNRSQTGRVLSGSQERRCGDNGAWTNQLPLCSEFRKILHCAVKIYKLHLTLLFASLLSAVRQLRSPQTRSSANCLGDMKQYKRERAQFARYSELWFLIWIRFGSHCRYQKNL